MYLHQLYLYNFKNYTEHAFTFSAKMNCIIGDNGVGKTNLLDAIHYLSFCKSYFNPVDLQNIRHGEEGFAINGSYYRTTETPETLQCIQRRHQRKKFLHNKKEIERLADHIGRFPLVMISPSDRDLINEGSEIRRKYIDSVISQFDKPYLDHLIRYNKALQQRNNLLKTFAERRTFDSETLEIWDAQLELSGTFIHERRATFIQSFIPLFQHYFRFITGGRESVDIRYISQLTGSPLASLLLTARKQDAAAQFTTQGTHKDDLELLLNEYPVKRFGSQGQQKSFVIAMKLAQFEYTRTINGFKPILLLDDVFDKLDDFRVGQLMQLVSENSFGQVFLTNTRETDIRRIFDPLKILYTLHSIPPHEGQQ